MEQDFYGDFQGNVTWFFASFSCVHDWIMLILVWFERSLHYTQVSEESKCCPWPLKLMTSQRVERTWIRTGGYGRFRGEWVNLWFWGLLAYPELYCDWTVHNQHSWNFSGVYGFLSVTVNKIHKRRRKKINWVTQWNHLMISIFDKLFLFHLFTRFKAIFGLFGRIKF